MKRQMVSLEELVGWDNLLLALWKASRGKRLRQDVAAFLDITDTRLKLLQEMILEERVDLQKYCCFQIRDPKPRRIVAVNFELRVLHHAIMNLIGGSLERSQIHSSYACLPGRGVHAAVQRVQRGLRSGGYYVKIDIEKYFENIDHSLLKEKLVRRFKERRFLNLLNKIIDSYSDKPALGLPIGSLTSQYFANFFLEKVDRFILWGSDRKCCAALVRLMYSETWVAVSKLWPSVAAAPETTTAGTYVPPVATTGSTTTTTTAFVLLELTMLPDGA